MAQGKRESRESAYTAIIERIRAMIAGGEITPGKRLPPERKLAERFGVSRSHLRQAFQALAERGVIESRQGDGTYLLTGLDQGPTVDTILDVIAARSDVLHEILEFRRMIEPQIAALAAERIDEPTLARLKVVVCDQQRALAAGREDAGFDAEFHRILTGSTRNHVVEKVMDIIQSILNESRAVWLQSEDRRQLSLQGHLQIIDALELGDSMGAAQAMRQHIASIGHLLFDELDNETEAQQ